MQTNQLRVTALLAITVLATCSPKHEPAAPGPPPPTTEPQPEPAAHVEPPQASTHDTPRPGPIPDYDRDDWAHWIDADGDCQGTRQEVLIEESEVEVTFKTERRCKVASGRWTCPYTGRVFTDPKQLDVDHMVPLRNAHVSGGWQWDADRKRDYANDLGDPEHLIAVYRGANRSKGAKGPEEWMPVAEGYRCTYVHDWREIKGRWGLSMNRAEAEVVEGVLEGCGQP